jgi:peptidoglycan/xylan/chitin deacetylase (PgdA/CDA1 family)
MDEPPYPEKIGADTMKTTIKKMAFGALSAVGSVCRTGGVSIIMYHSVDDEDSLISTPTKMFRAQMEYLRDNNISVISLKELYEALEAPGALPKKAVALTFDDGFEGVYENAFPILKEFGYPATLFVVTDSVGKTMGWERVKGICAYTLCTWEKLKEMDKGGIDIQSHTRTHPFLSELDDEGLASEIGGSKASIEENLDKKVEFLAYPYGNYDTRVIESLKKHGMVGAVVADFGKAKKGQNPFEIKRVGTELVSGRDSDMVMHFFRACVSGTASFYILLRKFMPLIVNRPKRSEYTEE